MLTVALNVSMHLFTHLTWFRFSK